MTLRVLIAKNPAGRPRPRRQVIARALRDAGFEVSTPASARPLRCRRGSLQRTRRDRAEHPVRCAPDAVSTIMDELRKRVLDDVVVWAGGSSRMASAHCARSASAHFRPRLADDPDYRVPAFPAQRPRSGGRALSGPITATTLRCARRAPAERDPVGPVAHDLGGRAGRDDARQALRCLFPRTVHAHVVGVTGRLGSGSRP